jgi:hypothetical protein
MAEQVKILRTRWVSIDSVIPHPENARQSNLDGIRRSLEDHAQYAPIVVHDATKQIIVHNHVHLLAKELGHKKIYATFVECSEQKARAVLAVDNRTSDLATNDAAALVALLEKLDASGDLSAGGYDLDELDDLRARLQEVDELEVPEHVSRDTPARTLDEQYADYGESGVRSIVIMLSAEAYVKLVDRLDLCQEHFETANYSDTVAALVEDYVAKVLT